MPKLNASDLHIKALEAAHYRINGDLVEAIKGDKPLSPERSKEIIYSLMNDEQVKLFEKELEINFSFQIENVARYRVNIFKQRGYIGSAIRLIPLNILTIAECGLPEKLIKNFCSKQKGLVLITGATGSGKSTTLAAMIDEINNNRKCHIVTIEDPIEFIHGSKKAFIDQREVHSDTHSFASSLHNVLRQDPDVILIGELRDLDSIRHAMTIAETGHLVFATLHTSDSVQSINRIVDVFPAHQQQQTRVQLSFVLIGVVSQQLLQKADDTGRVVATELLVATPPVRSMIRDEKTHQIYSIIQTSQKDGMRTMNQSLAELYGKKIITRDEALKYSPDQAELVNLL